jgi:hypothetical protein
MRRITIMSGPIKFRILAIDEVISTFRLPVDCSSPIQPIWWIYVPGNRFSMTRCGIQEREVDQRGFFLRESGIKRDQAGFY